ncbi:MAG: hypothetical protein Roseis2KO_24110 [Roseivirga sp.]
MVFLEGIWSRILLLCFLISLGCSAEKHDFDLTKAQLVKRYFTESDSVYLGDVGDLNFLNDQFFISESDNSRLLIFNSDFSLDTIVGRFGQGPGEYRMAGALGTAFGQFYLHDIAHGKLRFYPRSFESFNDIELLGPEEVNSFAISDSIIYYSSTDGKGRPIVAIDLKKDSIRRYGSFIDKGLDEFQKINRSQGYIFKQDTGFIYIYKSEPKAIVYDADFRVVSELDLSHLSLFKNSLIRADMTYRNQANTTVFLIDDAFKNGNKYYLSVYEDFETDNLEKNYGFRRKLNKLIKLNYAEDVSQLQLEEIIDLSDGGGWYNEILVLSDHSLYAFDGINHEIHKFEID